LRELGALALCGAATPQGHLGVVFNGAAGVFHWIGVRQIKLVSRGLGRTAHWASAECGEAADGVLINLGAGMAKACRLEGTSK
jgi:hypothetical protein